MTLPGPGATRGGGPGRRAGARPGGGNAAMSEHHASCHCGRIRLTLRETTTEASECNCSVCRRIGGLWHYGHPDAVTVEGEGASYRQGDRSLDLWHCPT